MRGPKLGQWDDAPKRKQPDVGGEVGKDQASGSTSQTPRASRKKPEYQWGSLKPMADFPEESEELPLSEKFEVLKAARHESTHLSQDLFSSFGCWSYCIGERILDELFRTGQESQGEPNEVFEAVIMLAQLRRWYKMSVTAIEQDPRRGTESIQKLKLLEILETDAMCSVHDFFYITLICGSFDRDVAWRNTVERELSSAIYPLKYMKAWEWYQRVSGLDRVSFIAHRMDRDTGRLKTSPYYTFRLLLDFALSTPFAVVGPKEAEMNPAERFLRAVTGVMSLPKASMKILNKAADETHRLFRFLDRMCGHSHDSWEACHHWISWLEKRYEATQDPIALVRADALLRKRDNYGSYLTHSPSIQPDWAGVPSWFEEGRLFIAPEEWTMPFSLKRYTDRLDAHEKYLVVLEILTFAKRLTMTGESCHIELDPCCCQGSGGSRLETVEIVLNQPLERDVPVGKPGSIESLVFLEGQP